MELSEVIPQTIMILPRYNTPHSQRNLMVRGALAHSYKLKDSKYRYQYILLGLTLHPSISSDNKYVWVVFSVKERHYIQGMNSGVQEGGRSHSQHGNPDQELKKKWDLQISFSFPLHALPKFATSKTRPPWFILTSQAVSIQGSLIWSHLMPLASLITAVPPPRSHTLHPHPQETDR